MFCSGIGHIIFTCAICWKYTRSTYRLLPIYSKTIYVSGLLLILFVRKNIILQNISPYVVKYYYKVYNQQITKLIKSLFVFIQIIKFLLLVGISETLRTLNLYVSNRVIYKNFIVGAGSAKSTSPALHNCKDGHDNYISLEFKQ